MMYRSKMYILWEFSKIWPPKVTDIIQTTEVYWFQTFCANKKRTWEAGMHYTDGLRGWLVDSSKYK